MQIKKKVTTELGMPIFGNIKNKNNIKILKFSLKQEKTFNDPTVSVQPLLTNYKENYKKYGVRLYEYDSSIKFIDVDVFRQPAITFQKFGAYCPFDAEWDKYGYLTFWNTIKYRLKNGMTAWAGIDANGEPVKIWITGKQYGFLNFAPINKVVDDDDAISNEKEFLSKSSDDNLAQFKTEQLIQSLQVRDVKTARKAIDFPDFIDAQYHVIMYKHICKLLGYNCWLGKARRKGLSYINGWDLFDDINMNPSISVILAAHDKKYLTHGKGLMRMLYSYSDFINKFTAFKKARLSNSKEHLKFGYIFEGELEERGYLSEALAVSAMNNPDVTIGKDAYQLAFEEMGKFPNWKECYNVTTSTAEAGDYKTGHICGWGTGGTEEANWEAFEDVCYNPIVYDGLACNNIWDSSKEGTSVAYFYAHVHGLEGHLDENGNTNFETAWASYIEKKNSKRASLSNQEEFEKWCGQRANSPQEAFAKSSTNMYPREVITKRLDLITRDKTLKYLYRSGKLIKNAGRVRLITNDELAADGFETHPPVFDFPLKRTTNVHGCFVQWIAPWKDPKTGLIPDGLYVAFQDPYAHDKDSKKLKTTDSLGVTYWYENFNKYTPSGGGMAVASYIGRPPKMDYYNEQVSYGLELYNSKLMFENDRGDTKPFMQARRLLHYLFEEPELQFAKDIAGKTGRGFGMHMTDKRIPKAAIYLRDMLTYPITKDKIFLDFCFDPGFLRELLRWQIKGNFDRVSAWLVGMYIIKELEHIEIAPQAAVNENSLFNRKLF